MVIKTSWHNFLFAIEHFKSWDENAEFHIRNSIQLITSVIQYVISDIQCITSLRRNVTPLFCDIHVHVLSFIMQSNALILAIVTNWTLRVVNWWLYFKYDVPGLSSMWKSLSLPYHLQNFNYMYEQKIFAPFFLQPYMSLSYSSCEVTQGCETN